jgi:hypothetical protein
MEGNQRTQGQCRCRPKMFGEGRTLLGFNGKGLITWGGR